MKPFSSIILIAVIVFWFCGPVIAQEKICSGCGKVIATDENYKIVLDRFYHPEHFLCFFCKKVIEGEFIFADGRFLHRECYKNHFLLRCDVCNKPLDSTYVTLNFKNYHEHCYRESIAPRCDLCGAVIENEYIEDFWGNIYHAWHQNDHPQCWYCGRFISSELSKGEYHESNDQIICGICSAEAVSEMSTARVLFDRVRLVLAEMGINTLGADLDLRLSSWNELRQLTRAASKNHTGFTESEEVYFNGEKLNEKFKIYILHTLPTFHFIATSAHELMHVWQHLYGSDYNRLQVVEGSCNYAAYLMLNTYGEKKAQYMIESLKRDESPVYGDGFRMIKNYVETKGKEVWLHDLKIGLEISSE